MKYLNYLFIILLIIFIICLSIYNSSKVLNIENFIPNQQKNFKCKYISSYDKNPKCPSQFKNYSGATFGAKNTELYCNGDIIKNDTAIAEAIISNGTIKNIKILNKGNNYIKKPNIKIVSKKNDIIWIQKNGKNSKKGVNAFAEAVVKDNKIEEIIIKNAGSFYYKEPEIIIDEPDGMVFCHLCCN